MPAPILPPTSKTIAEAARWLAAGELVALPTETVYGLAADATNDAAVTAVYSAKNRPPHNPLIVHVATTDAARELGLFDDRAEALAQALWPGPLTLVLSRASACPAVARVSAGLPTIAIRVPEHDVTRAVLAALGRPVAAPSANPSGRVSPTTAQHVADGLSERVAAIVDGGPSRIGLESTVVGLTGVAATLLRAGGVPRETIEAMIGSLARPTSAPPESPLLSPGQLSRHYAPSRPLRLAAADVGAEEALLAFGEPVPEGAAACRNLSPSGDLDEAAANLFAMLHELDQPRFKSIAVMTIPETGLGAAINDRLRRAASTDVASLVAER